MKFGVGDYVGDITLHAKIQKDRPPYLNGCCSEIQISNNPRWRTADILKNVNIRPILMKLGTEMHIGPPPTRLTTKNLKCRKSQDDGWPQLKNRKTAVSLQLFGRFSRSFAW